MNLLCSSILIFTFAVHKLQTMLISNLYLHVLLLVQGGPTPPPPGAPTPPGLRVPIDENIWVLALAAVAIIAYTVAKKKCKFS